MIRTRTDEIYGRNPITTATDFRVHTLNIDSQYRKTQMEPSTDFQYPMPQPIKNVIHAKVRSVEFPDPLVHYNVSTARNNRQWAMYAMDYIGQEHFLELEVPEGVYHRPADLVNAIQEQFDGLKDRYGLFFRITLDDRTQRITILHDGSAPPPCPHAPTHCATVFGLTWMMVGQEDRPSRYGMGGLLGFMKGFYTVESPFQITAEAPIQLHPDRYWLIAINDYHAVEHRNHQTLIQCMAKIPIQKVLLHSETGGGEPQGEVTFTAPQDIRHLRIRLLDQEGHPVDLREQEWSMTLEVTEVMNMQMYDFYRTTQWPLTEPRATKQTSGSSAGIAPPALNYH